VTRSFGRRCSLLVAVCCSYPGAVRAQGLPLATASPPASTEAARAVTDAGRIVGSRDRATGVRAFLGVPFAAPPVGARRWRPPEPVAPWTGERAATAFGPACFQRTYDGGEAPHTSEDCLSLNVWSAAAPGERRPVLVWIYGGAFVYGRSDLPETDGSELARRGAVVVSFNYRVGTLGFLAHPALDAESPRGVSGNYGLLDQIAALRWVRRNIAAFGGDPARVTVFGQSAGGMSVGMLLASPLAAGLFQRAILQSGTGAGFALPLDAPAGQRSAHAAGNALARALDVSGRGTEAAAALRRATPEALEAAMRRITNPFEFGDTDFRPIVDGWVLPRPVQVAIRDGKAHRVPIIVGVAADEMRYWFPKPPVRTVATVDSMRRANWGAGAPDVARLYPVVVDSDIPKQAGLLYSDSLFRAPARVFTKAAASRGWPVYEYRFTRVADSGRAATQGASHGSDVPFPFGRAPSDSDFRGHAAYDARLADVMSVYWLAFAATGNPNGGGRPAWPRYDPRRDEYLELGKDIGVRRDSLAERLDVLARWERELRDP
jgi:para-nitrobenzyl esterase